MRSPSVSLARALKIVNQTNELPCNHLSALIDVGQAVVEALNTGRASGEHGLRIVTVVEIFSHSSRIN